MMNYSKQSGNALIVIIIVIAVVVMGALGYVLWNNFIREQPLVVANNPSEDVGQAQFGDDSISVTDWTRYETNQLSIPIPDGWKLQVFTNESGERLGILIQQEDISIEESLTYTAGIPATIVEVNSGGGRGFTQHFGLITSEDDRAVSLEDDGFTFVTSSNTATGEEIRKYVKYFETESGGVGAYYPAGTYVYIYEIKTDETNINVTYQLNPQDQADNVVQLETALQAFRSL